MKIDVSLAQRVDRPADEVAAFAMDPRNAPRWVAGVHHSAPEGDGPIAVGTRIHQQMTVMGHSVNLTAEVTEYDPPHAMATHTLEGPVDVTLRHTFEPLDDGATLVRIQADGSASGMAGWAAGRAIEKGVAESLRRLAAEMESADGGG